MSNWSELPYDLLVEIAGRIKKLEHFIAFGVVCKRWCTAGKKEYFKGLCLRQETPYLMLPVRDDSDNDCEFYSLVESEIVASVRIPNFKVKKCHESLGWLLAMEKDGSMCLLDPFSSAEIPVPHESTFPNYNQLDEYTFIRKMVLSARPSETFDFVLMIICGGSGDLGFWRPGDKSWNRIEIRGGGLYCDVMYFGGRFYAINTGGYVRVFTIEGDKLPKCRNVTRFIRDMIPNSHARDIEDPVWADALYILKTSQSLFVIARTAYWWSEKDNRLYSNTCKIRVYEVDKSTSKWTEIKSIGNMAVFGSNTTNQNHKIYYQDHHKQQQKMSFNIKEYAVEAAKKYAVNSMSDNYRHDNISRREHVPYGNSMTDTTYERRVIEKPVVYEVVETEIIRPAHHQHQQYYEPVPERRIEYAEYERGTEYDRDGRSVYETDGYVKQGRVFGGY